MPWAILAAGALSAGAGIYASGEAADAQKKGNQRAIAEQQRQYNTSLAMVEPQRYLGYQALGDLASLYGYGMAGYQPYNALLGGAVNGVNLNTQSGGGGFLGLGGSRTPSSYGGQIDPTTGMVDVAGKGPEFDQVFTNYLRTGEVPEFSKKKKEKRFEDLMSEIAQLRGSGWSWNAETGRGAFPGEVQGTPPTQGASGSGAGNMSRFFASPDYNFRRDEGIRGIEQGAAARGGALSGNALRGVTNYSSNLASGEFGNYINRLLSMAGMNQTATSQAIGAGQNAANNISAGYQGIGDARASGIMGGANSAMNALNSGVNAWMWGRYLNQQPTGQPTGMSQYGPYASGYRFPGG